MLGICADYKRVARSLFGIMEGVLLRSSHIGMTAVRIHALVRDMPRGVSGSCFVE